MTNEEQRIAIAEYCGWTECHAPQNNHILWGNDPVTKYSQFIPSYTIDLNAMHEAEKTLQHYGFYCDILADVMKVSRGSFMIAFATAEQRAEAFVKTINNRKGKEYDPIPTKVDLILTKVDLILTKIKYY